jgi:hypothetical protein
MTTKQYLWGLFMALVAAALTYILNTEAPAAVAVGAGVGGAWIGGAKSMLRSLR